MIRRNFANAKMIIAFIHLQNVKMRETRKVKKFTKRREMSLLINKGHNKSLLKLST